MLNAYKWIAVSFLIIFSACSSGINTISRNGSFTETRIGSLFLDDQVKVVDLITENNEGIKKVNVKILNLIPYEMDLEVKMDFFDEHGIKIENPWGWKPFSLEEEQSDWIGFIAPNSQAKDFTLYIQRAGN